MASVGQLTAEIVLSGMDSVQRQLNRFSDSMNDVADRAGDFGDRMRDAGEGLNDLSDTIAPLSAGLLAIGGASVVASDNIQGAMGKMQASLGLSDSQMGDYGETLQTVAETGVGSFEEVGDAITSVSQSMKGVDQKDLASVSTQAQGLAKLMGEDVGNVTKTAGQLMQQFGVDGSGAMDLIAKGYQNGMNYADDYTDTLNEYSVYFKNLGFDADDMFNTLISGSEAGAFNLDKVGDAVKEFGIRSKDGSDASKDAFKSLGFDADKMTKTFAKGGEGAKKAYSDVVTALSGVSDEAERNRIGVELFGTQYEDMEKDVIASTANVKDAMKGTSGTADEMIEKNKTFAQEMAGYWAQIQYAIKPLGDSLRKIMADVMPSIVAGIKGISDAFNGLSPTMQKVVIAMGAFVAVLPIIMMGLGGILALMGTMATGFGFMIKTFTFLAGIGPKIVSGFKLIVNVFKVLRMLFIASPWGLAITGITLLATVIYKNWDSIKEYTVAIWDGIKAVCGAVWEGIKATVMTFVGWYVAYIKTVLSVWKAIWSACKKVVSVVWSAIKTILLVGVAIIGTILSPIFGFFKTVFNKAKAIVKSVIEAMKPIIASISAKAKSVMAMVKNTFQSVWNTISGIVKKVISVIVSVIKSLIAKVSAILNSVKAVFSRVWSAISGVVKSFMGKIVGVISPLTSKVSGILGKVKGVFSSAWSKIKDTVGGAVGGMVDKIKGMWSAGSDVASRLKNAFSGIFKGIKTPHFSMSNASLNPKDWIKNGMPKINVAWHAKGGILDSSTFIGAGEKGAEAIVPLSSQRRMKPFANAVAKFMPNGGSTGHTSINVSSLVVREEADVIKVAQQLNKLQNRADRARGGMVLNG